MNIPDLPRGVTSFGSAVLNDAVYIYGGHVGASHTYCVDDQSNALWRYSLRDEDSEWESLTSDVRVQGLASSPI